MGHHAKTAALTFILPARTNTHVLLRLFKVDDEYDEAEPMDLPLAAAEEDEDEQYEPPTQHMEAEPLVGDAHDFFPPCFPPLQLQLSLTP